ncbi:2-hydroxychromene-2-carboxylate isomerase [Xanthobacter sp. YC-JY1]|uniref:2-hydroxychromene-2-carboxylate isomerase n=1 Tax=Xanthobacter TaxID=279 RepID=UPI001F3233E5|nr:2-hydroxychromene-2-carboxylate isomerase [Xanthobacter sp. YC-JY1]UJX44279.1 2-hydroxychromene-2-carboxylate isomerase [Xanthobacter sp. YC-JY1]
MATSFHNVDFYFDYGSPNSYLAYRRLPAIVERTGATVEYIPIALGAVFLATQNHSPAAVSAKRKNSSFDLRRFSNKYEIEFNENPFFPINSLQLMRGGVAALEVGVFERYSEAIWRAMWVGMKNLGDPQVFRSVISDVDIDCDGLIALASAYTVKEKLRTLTDAAVHRGVFGAPTFFVKDEMFFGQDRLDFVEDALRGRTYVK